MKINTLMTLKQLSTRQKLLANVLGYENDDGKFDYLKGELERIANKIPYSKGEEYYKREDSRVGTMNDKLESFSIEVMDFADSFPEYLNDEGQGSFNKHVKHKLSLEGRCIGKRGTQAVQRAVDGWIYFQDEWNTKED